ncbi:hypothetical protein FSP39_000052 [Pinctada imbricata]|uniref:Uncharacterized protein n=1 Tax=Pinctada imbricata TaxID=66713 RepID=A0AA89BV99_PINIB|nr:hypothetical protein FSP39_000052 [Pinctada imbricata]
MTLYMPPLQKKKRVPSRYNPDSFRVISQDAETTHPKYNPVPDYRPPTPERERTGVILPDIYNRNTQVMPKTQPDFRANKPHPGSCGFLRHNVRGLNEPICSVFTRDTHVEQNQWWPSRTSNDPLDEPPKTKDTTYRGDFMKDEYGDLHRTTRHESNLNREAALGAVPVNFLRNKDGSQRVYKETKSYEHDYNCRSATNYPIRGRRVGSFVYDEMNPKTTKKFIDQHSRLLDQEAVYRKHLESNTTSTSSSSSQSLPGGGSQSSSSQGTGTPPRGGSEVPPSVPPQPDQGAPMLPSAQVNGQGGPPMLPSAQENGQVGAPATVEENTASSPPARVASAPAPVEVTPSLPPAKEPSTNKTVTFDMSQNES